jgi:geranylgeranyl pyrophosphate synthase
VRRDGAIEESIREAEEHVSLGLERLRAFPPSPHLDALSELCRFTVRRIH